MNNGAASPSTTRLTDPRWTIAGVGDYAGNGKSDSMWNGAGVVSATTLLTSPAWHLTNTLLTSG